MDAFDLGGPALLRLVGHCHGALMSRATLLLCRGADKLSVATTRARQQARQRSVRYSASVTAARALNADQQNAASVSQNAEAPGVMPRRASSQAVP
jgi:hypothetical protein